jgi:hypothetical protein
MVHAVPAPRCHYWRGYSDNDPQTINHDEGNMKILRALASLVLVIIIGFMVFHFVYKAQEANRLKEIEERRLVRFDLDSIKKFVLVRPDSSVVFERGIGRIWNITDPIETEADKEQLFKLFNSLDMSDILVEVENEPDDYDIYGLVDTEYALAMEYDETSPDTLFFGNDTPDGTMSYVRYATEDRVLAVTKQLTFIAERPVLYFRSRTLLNVVAQDVMEMDMISNMDGVERQITLRNSGSRWIMTHPWKHPADFAHIDLLGDKLTTGNKIDLIEEHPTDLAKYGFDDPTVIVNLSLRHNQPNKILLIGDQLTEKGETYKYYAKRFDHDLVFTVEKSLVGALTHDPSWYMMKSVMEFERGDVDRIVFESGDRPITFRKDNAENWSVISPVDKNVEEITLNSIFALTRFALAYTIYTTEPTEEQIQISGIDDPSLRITLLRGATEVASITYGNSFIDRNQMTYFRTSYSPVIYLTNIEVNARVNTVLETVFGG